MKILHLPSSVGGNAYSLAIAERKLGLDSKVLTFNCSRFAYDADIKIDLSDRHLLAQLFYRAKAFLKYRKGYDVYHFNFGSTILHAPQLGLNLADLPFYDANAKKIFCYQGCDARQKYPTLELLKKSEIQIAACQREGCYNGMCNSGKKDKQRQKAIDKMAQYADHVFALNPDLIQFLPKEKTSFLPYTIANYFDIETKQEPFFKNDKINIVHAPTQRVTKGTDIILKIIDELQQEFPNKIKFNLIENMSHSEALQAYQKADLLIDQIFIGWYGAVAVEVMKMGIPAAVFINPAHLNYVPDEFAKDLPFYNINPFTLKEKLRHIIKHREQLIQQGQLAKQFVLKWHDPIKIAEEVIEYYR